MDHKQTDITSNTIDDMVLDLHQKPTDIIAIVGPTCTGKTSLAIRLARKLNLEIINADSRLVFDEMNIGTAKPKQEELNQIRHHLINIRKPDQRYSAGAYQRDFDAIMEQFLSEKNMSKPKAIVVGGTGLYLKAALGNLDMPDVEGDSVLRDELRSKDLDELYVMLNELDPEALNTIDAKNKIRVIRAIEILKTGAPCKLSELRKKSSEDRYEVKYFGLNLEPRRTLYDLINKRVVTMVKSGLVYEVESLFNKYGATETLMSTIGYPEMYEYLCKRCTLNEAIRLIQRKTRRYAKRQITWFKSNPKIKWLCNGVA